MLVNMVMCDFYCLWDALSGPDEHDLRLEVEFSLLSELALCQHVKRVHKNDLFRFSGVLRPLCAGVKCP